MTQTLKKSNIIKTTENSGFSRDRQLPHQVKNTLTKLLDEGKDTRIKIVINSNHNFMTS